MEQALTTAITTLNHRKKQITSVGVVSRIEGNTCEVEREDLPLLLDVRLNAVQGVFENCLNIVPKIGSQVLCLEVEGEPSETCIVGYTEIDSIEVKIDGAVVKIAKGKIQIKNNFANLKQLLSEWLTELKTVVIQTPAGVGNFSPNNVAKFSELESKINQLLE
jgi:hypothetical protein